MPGRDRTGSMGAGPRSGRGMGYCGGYDRPRSANIATGFHGWFGFGRGDGDRGWRHRFYATGVQRQSANTPEQEAANLNAQADLLKAQQDAIQKRIEELTKCS